MQQGRERSGQWLGWDAPGAAHRYSRFPLWWTARGVSAGGPWCNPGAPTNKILPDIPCSQELVGVRTRGSLALGQISASASITTLFFRFFFFCSLTRSSRLP